MAPMDTLIAKAQKQLVDFLEADLALGFTFLQTANLEAATHKEHSDAAREKAQAVLDSVRRFIPRIQNAATRDKFETRAGELEAGIENQSNALDPRIRMSE